MAVIGVGAVGIEIIRVLNQRKFPVKDLRVFARSARKIEVDGISYGVETIEGADFSGINIALFAGTEGEKGAAVQYADKFIEKGAVVIDNGSDFRMRKDVPLVVPEVNSKEIAKHKGLIANPNCTTIQALTALGGIYKKFGLKKFILTSFQAVSGAGKGAVTGLWEETKEIVKNNENKDFDNSDKKISGKPRGFNYQIAFNVIPQISGFAGDNYTEEEWKVVKETHKIFDNKSIKVSATCVRVPVFTSHSEAIYFTPREKTSVEKLEKTLRKSAGVIYLSSTEYALPLDVEGRDDVFVSRLRRDPFDKNSFWLWCVADNLRKGAALNAVQIAENLICK